MKKQSEKAAALKYMRGKDSAPRLVAKGRGKVAEKIIEIAKAHGIPVKEDKDLVELLSVLDLYREIPPDLYKAVAEILAFVYSLKNRKPGLQQG
ncbi:MAG TPA: flagellar biosynthesis protein FlhB [Nitrospirae bacterium]|nr:flagellar biosynthetic protein FlhB [bacterium BMS3Abin06]GBE32163.1 flagellar biosynthetic protein FlhB [bacterium BMS3Bbin05]HDH13290.1 flagellar biosynthesis protein FlhB [Nitrospirota bacterium]HDZ00086.1 flagellar biosynthesis protein FlhB [Nitrospirota bacterium]